MPYESSNACHFVLHDAPNGTDDWFGAADFASVPRVGDYLHLTPFMTTGDEGPQVDAEPESTYEVTRVVWQNDFIPLERYQYEAKRNRSRAYLNTLPPIKDPSEAFTQSNVVLPASNVVYLFVRKID